MPRTMYIIGKFMMLMGISLIICGVISRYTGLAEVYCLIIFAGLMFISMVFTIEFDIMEEGRNGTEEPQCKKS